MNRWVKRALGALLFLGVMACLIFVWPNFYGQYRMLVGVTLTDLSEEEVGIIRDNLDFSLPQEAVVHSAFDNNLQESTFRLVFSIPEECVEAMETSLSDNGYVPVSRERHYVRTIEIDGQSYSSAAYFERQGRAFTGIYKYAKGHGFFCYELDYNRPPARIGEIFHQRVFLF